jgi:tetratricopeptide (TPR) repeat protein
MRTCPHCGAPLLDVAWKCKECGTELVPRERSRKEALWRPLVALGATILGACLVAAIIWQRYRVRTHYQLGVEALRAGNCERAVAYFDQVLQTSQLLGSGEYGAKAEYRKQECEAFLDPVVEEEAGEWNQALLGYLDFLRNFKAGDMREEVGERVSALARRSDFVDFATPDSCDALAGVLDLGVLDWGDEALAAYYLSCSQVYALHERWESSFDLLLKLLSEYPDNPPEEALESVIVGNPRVCQDLESMQEEPALAGHDNLMAGIYFHCAQALEAEDNHREAFSMYVALIRSYPESPLVEKAALGLLESPLACEREEMLRSLLLAKAPDTFPPFYYLCGQRFEAQENLEQAIALYQRFLDLYEGHELFEAVEEALARAVVERAQFGESTSLGSPDEIGLASEGAAQVVVANGTNERLRIALVGPELLVGMMAPCKQCSVVIVPLFEGCPSEAEETTFTLAPGKYQAVVDVVGSSYLPPARGEWHLQPGVKYFICLVERLQFGD